MLVILAGVSITAVLSQNGVIGESKEAKEKTLNAEVHEQEQMNEVIDYINDKGKNKKKLISKDESYVGYYADVDGDGIADGVIYADLAVGGSGQWGTNGKGTFSYDAITGAKEYYISQTNYEGSFGTKDVLTATGSGEDRFYVMTLEDLNGGACYMWYDAAYDDGIKGYSLVTSTSFGTGKMNTETMIEKWNNSEYGKQNDSTYKDMWGEIQDKANEGWFVPSNEEWAAFSNNLEITSSNYEDYELSDYYWTSSLAATNRAMRARFYNGCMSTDFFIWYSTVRLSITF